MYAVSTRLLPTALVAALPSVFAVAFALTLFPVAVFFGGHFPLAQVALPVMCAILLGCTALLPSYRLAGKSDNRYLAAVAVPVLLALLLAALQLLPLPAGSALASPYWGFVGAGAPWHAATVSIPLGIMYLTAAVGYACAALALFRMGQHRPELLLIITSAVITLTSLYGIVVFASGNHAVLWLPKTSYVDSLSATFINRNSFATFAGLGVLANLGLLLRRVGEISQRLNPRQRLRAFVLLVLKPGLPWVAMGLICFMALILTNSRAGITASMAGVLVLLGSLAYIRPPARWPLVAMVATLLVASAITLAAVGDKLGSRLNDVSRDADIRHSIYELTGTLISHNKLSGTGLGTFWPAFGTVRTPEFLTVTPYIVDHAHNTYFELTSELGFTGAVLLTLAVVVLLVSYLNGLRVRRRAVIWPALGVASLVLLGGHALADFSLSIPAVTLAALAILMPALAQSFPLKEGEGPTPPAPSARYALIALPLAAALALVAGWQTAAGIHAQQASATMRGLATAQPVKLGDLFLAQNRLMECLAVNRYHPTCGADLAQVDLALATTYGLNSDYSGVALVYLNLARQQYLNTLAVAPVNPLAWYRLARITAYLGERPLAATYLANSVLTGPAEPKLAAQRIALMLDLMPDAGADNARLFEDNIRSLWANITSYTASEIHYTPAIQPQLAALLGNSEATQATWARYIKTPFPSAQTAP